jgi:glycosyltransferase involved in cell wall biosynthesis
MSNLAKYGVVGEKVRNFINGISLSEITAAAEPIRKEYDACFLGGFRPSKGIFDLVPIWRRVVSRMPTAKLLVIGGGLERYVTSLKDEVDKTGLTKNIILSGVIPQPELFGTLKKCKVFISPSHEEGWGIVIGEALAAGLPVVAFNLPAYTQYGSNIEKIPIGEIGIFSDKIIQLLSNEEKFNDRKTRGIEFAKGLGWDEAARVEAMALDFLKKENK